MNSRLIVYTFLVLTAVSSGNCSTGLCSPSCSYGCCGSIRYKRVCCPAPGTPVVYPPGVIAAIVCAVLFPIITICGIACCRVYCCGSSTMKHRHVMHTRPLAVINTGCSTETDDLDYPIRPRLGARQFRPPSTASSAYSPPADNSRASTFQPLSAPPPSYNECVTTDTTIHKSGPMVTTV